MKNNIVRVILKYWKNKYETNDVIISKYGKSA